MSQLIWQKSDDDDDDADDADDDDEVVLWCSLQAFSRWEDCVATCNPALEVNPD